jgi:hypothetical protein
LYGLISQRQRKVALADANLTADDDQPAVAGGRALPQALARWTNK